jgi:hypothetical protein
VFFKKRITWGDKHGETREKSARLSSFSFCHSVLLSVRELLDMHCPCWPVVKETFGYENVPHCLGVAAVQFAVRFFSMVLRNSPAEEHAQFWRE